MFEPWKKIVCQNEQCFQESLTESGEVKPGFHLSPDLDTAAVTQFTCPRCGQVETWGVTRRQVAKVLYERLRNA
jgi:hypothetical protein